MTTLLPRAVMMDDLPGLVGTTLGRSRPQRITQKQIGQFADATRDHQWLHVDPVRAGAGPYGAPIAHGFLTLALGTALLWEIIDVTDAAQVINYGLNKVRFPAPVRVGSDLTMSADLLSLRPVLGGSELTLRVTFSVAGQAKPACVAETILRYLRAT